jgi:hypothetical protein
MFVEISKSEEFSKVILTENFVYRLFLSEDVFNKTMQNLNLIESNSNLDIISTHEVDTLTISELTRKIPTIESINLVLQHPRIDFISYPHEWCRSMLKDAARFHLKLSVLLSKYGLFLKDAHPWNILFSNSKFVFIDITSIVDAESLLRENTLLPKFFKTSKFLSKRFRIIRIYTLYFMPYFIKPLINSFFFNEETYRVRFEQRTLNVAPESIRPNYQGTLNSSKFDLLKGFKQSIIIRSKFRIRFLELILKGDVLSFFQNVDQIVTSIKLKDNTSPYLNYYKAKSEENSFLLNDGWNDKQLTVFDELQNPEYSTVLDLACNTGWFSKLSSNLGKKVISFDIDHACIEQLYSYISEKKLDVLPLVIDLNNLSDVVKSQNQDNGILLIDAQSRFKCDIVLALGLIHHMYLGYGKSFEEIFDLFDSFTKHKILIEFVSLEDSKIKDELEFFSAAMHDKNILIDYRMEKLVTVIKSRGYRVHKKPSYPSTRTILICEKS